MSDDLRSPSTSSESSPLFKDHPRTHQRNRYVYPVLSRRAKGVSIGVNLNVNKACNFHCIYCQVMRPEGRIERVDPVDLSQLEAELDAMLRIAASGQIFQQPPLDRTPLRLRRVNDIALSGDGEPTASPQFEQAVELCASLRRRYALDDVKIVLITNASLLHRDNVRRALRILAENNGELWAKLDAGTEQYYRFVSRSAVPFRRILDNLRNTARDYPLVIQTLLMRVHGQPPSPEEIDAYCRRLGEIAAAGTIKLVQLYTVARRPSQSWVAPLSAGQLDRIARRVAEQTQLAVEQFGGY